MNRICHFLFVIPLISCLWIASVDAQAVSGGPYSISHSTVTGGGGSHVAGTYSLQGTIGQPSASAPSSGGTYAVSGGFWQPLLAPTAAGVSISGKVVNRRGAGVRDAFLVLWGSGLTSTKVVRTNMFGSFRFDGLPAGDFYMITVEHRSYAFEQASISFSATENIRDLIFKTR